MFHSSSSLFRRPLPAMFAVLIIGIAVINALATAFFLYWHLAWLDMVMHFLGGFWVAGVTLWARYFSAFTEYAGRMGSPRHVFLWALGGALFVGVLWEVFEFTLDVITGGLPYDMIDTASDIFWDALGATAAGFFFWHRGYHTRAFQ